MPAKEKEAKGATPGGILKIYVHFGLEETSAGAVTAETLDTLRERIIAKFSDDTRKFPAPDKLIVQTKEADNKLQPLENNAKLKLDGVLKPDKDGDYDVYVSFPQNPAKRALEQQSFCYPKRTKRASMIEDHKIEPKASRKLERLTQYADAVRITLTASAGTPSFILFGIQRYLPIVKAWVSHLFKPTSLQTKQLLLVHGAVKSGKTTFTRDALPHLLLQLQDGMEEFKDKTFCFAYIDLSSLTQMHSPEEKWKEFWAKLNTAFPDQLPRVDISQVPSWKEEVKRAFRSLKELGDAMWFISLDEFHHLFSGLDENQVANTAETAKHIFLDNDSPCHFLLGGSTQATFWSAVGKAKDNGVRILHEAHVLTTPFEVPEDEMKECRECLVQLGVATTQVVEAAEKLLLSYESQRTPVNLTQVVLLASSGGSVEQACETFFRAKQSVFRRDYIDFPDPDMVNQILGWAEGSSVEPSRLYSHLLTKRNNLYYIRDQDFLAFLKPHFDSTQGKLIVPLGLGPVLPLMDIMLFTRLIPLGQPQTEQKMDEQKFEAQAAAFAATHFDVSQQGAFRTWLVNGPDPFQKDDPSVNPNYTYSKTHPDPAASLTSWVLVMKLLGSIFGHQKDVAWRDLALVKTRVLAYMKTSMNVVELVQCYVACKL